MLCDHTFQCSFWYQIYHKSMTTKFVVPLSPKFRGHGNHIWKSLSRPFRRRHWFSIFMFWGDIPVYQVSCFYHKVHDSINYRSAGLLIKDGNMTIIICEPRSRLSQYPPPPPKTKKEIFRTSSKIFFLEGKYYPCRSDHF